MGRPTFDLVQKADFPWPPCALRHSVRCPRGTRPNGVDGRTTRGENELALLHKFCLNLEHAATT